MPKAGLALVVMLAPSAGLCLSNRIETAEDRARLVDAIKAQAASYLGQGMTPAKACETAGSQYVAYYPAEQCEADLDAVRQGLEREHNTRQQSEAVHYPEQVTLATTRFLSVWSWGGDPAPFCRIAGVPAARIEACAREALRGARHSLLTKSAPPSNCYQWAVTRGSEFEAAREDMSAHLFPEKSPPVRFVGSITDAGDNRLLVSGRSGSAIIRTDSKTAFFRKDRIAFGRGVAGIGRQVGTETGEGTEGGTTTVPVLAAECLEYAGP